MAVARIELSPNEFEGLLARLRDVQKGHDLWRAKQEIKRGLKRANESLVAEKANMRRVRAKRHHVPDFDEEPLIPPGMLSDKRPER